MFFIQERKEGEGSGDEDGATSRKLESDSDEDSESEEETVCYSLLSVSCSDCHHHPGTLYFYCRENLRESVVS